MVSSGRSQPIGSGVVEYSVVAVSDIPAVTKPVKLEDQPGQRSVVPEPSDNGGTLQAFSPVMRDRPSFKGVFALSALSLMCTGAVPAKAKQQAWTMVVSGQRASLPTTGQTATTLHQAIDAAWRRLPQRDVLKAQQDVAAAHDLAGSAFLPNAPTANGTYVDDKIAGSNQNYITTQVGVSTPIWLPGEGTATQNAARAQGVAIDAQTAMTHLDLARQVLRLATDAEAALNSRLIARRRLTTGEALAADLAHRFAVGESAQSDALAADAEAADARIGLAQADLKLEASRLALAELTGSRAIPLLADTVALPMPALAVALDAHPRVIAAARAVQAARAQARLVAIQDRDDPELGVEGINEKQPGTPWDTRFGVTLKFHFATEARNAPRRAAAEEVVTRALVQLELIRRQVAAQAELARATVLAADRASLAATQGVAVLEQRRGQIERAWRLGEMPLIELVRANALAFNAESARDKAHIDRVAAALDLEIAAGTMP